MTGKNTSHLAGEFLVAGELSRRGYPVSITMGNAKSVDIYADTRDGVIKVDAKGSRRKGNWPIASSSVDQDVYYIFVYLQNKNEKFPEYYITSGKEIISSKLIKTWKTRQGITYSDLNRGGYREAWGKLPPP